MGQRCGATHMAVGRGRRVPSFRIRHVTLERCDAAGSGQSRKLVARPRRCSVLSGLSHDLAPNARSLLNAAFDGAGTTLDLERCRLLDWWHHIGGDTISVASCWNQRVATPHSAELGLRHSSRQYPHSVSKTPLRFSYSGVPDRSGHRLPRQSGTVSRRLQRGDWNHMVKIRLAGIHGPRLADRFRAHFAARPASQSTSIAK